MVNAESCMKGYSVYTSVKLVSVACVLMWAAAVKRREVDDTYFSAAVCDSCLSASQQHPELLFEFGRCAYGWRFGQKANNLLRPGGFWEIGVGSAVYSYTPTAGLILAATVIMAVFLPLVSWHACGLNFDYALGPRDPNAGAYDRFDRDLRDRRDQGNGNANANGGGNGAAGGGAAGGAAEVSGSGEAESEQRRATRLNYGFGFVTHNDQCVFLHYQVALLSGLLIIVLSLLISELYKFNAIPSSGAGGGGGGAIQQCWVSAYNQPMNTGFDVLTILALVLLLVEAGVNLCVPQHRFFFNVLTGLAMLSVAVLASVMAFTNVLGPANDWLTFWTTIVGVLHLFEVPIVLLSVVSRSRPVDYMHL